MGIAAAPRARYENAIRKLFPQGEYWEKQFADPGSDASLFVEAKAAELKRFRERMGALLDEGKPESATGLVSGWERVLLDGVFPSLGIGERRLQLGSKNGLIPNRAGLQKTAAIFGLDIQGITIPFRPAFFGHACFGADRLASPAAFSVLLVCASRPKEEMRDDFEAQIISRLLSNYIVYFIYGGD